MTVRLPWRLGTRVRGLWSALCGIPPVSHAAITAELIRCCIGRPDPTILELGCNDGSETLWFLEIFERPKIYCFEPDPRAIASFRQKVGERGNVELFEVAVSDRHGEAVFHQSDGQPSGDLREDGDGHDHDPGLLV